MSEDVRIGTWMGRPVEDLDKDELLNVIKHLASENMRIQKDRDKWCAAGDPLKYLMSG